MRDPKGYDPNAEHVGEIIQGRPTNQTDTAEGSIVTATTIADVLGAFDALLKAANIKELSGETEQVGNSDILKALNTLINKPTSELAELMTIKLKQESTARADQFDQHATKVEQIKKYLTAQIYSIKKQETERASYCKEKRIILQDRVIQNETDIKTIQEETKQIKQDFIKQIDLVKKKESERAEYSRGIRNILQDRVIQNETDIKAIQEEIKQIKANQEEIKQVKQTFSDHNAAQLIINDSIKKSISTLSDQIKAFSNELKQITDNHQQQIGKIKHNEALIEANKLNNQFTQSKLTELKTNAIQVEKSNSNFLTDYAVGTTLLAFCNKKDYDPNDTVTVHINDQIHTSEKYMYDFSVIDGAKELAGLWRCRGFVASGGNNALLAQRVDGGNNAMLVQRVE